MNSQGSLTGAAEMTQTVQKALLADKATARYPIEVIVEGAAVTLTGDVDSQEDKEAAERIARSVSGVASVVNELVVRPHKDAGLFR